MQPLEVSGAVLSPYGSLGFKGLRNSFGVNRIRLNFHYFLIYLLVIEVQSLPLSSP